MKAWLSDIPDNCIAVIPSGVLDFADHLWKGLAESVINSFAIIGLFGKFCESAQVL